MAAEKIHIEQFLSLSAQHPVIDVRSPSEYNHAHIPGAYSLPLFTDKERKIVGTTYKQQSREAAIKTGLDFWGPKMRKMVEQTEQIVADPGFNITNAKTVTPHIKTVLIYCWRGGMRSGAVSWLLDMYGFKVYTLFGGYKKFRNYVLDTFKLPFQFNILGGYTGSGKTELLKALQQKGESVIDLEDMAKHKGSAFGNIGMPPQPSQEMFENLLALALRNLSARHSHDGGRVWLEDESQRIGHLNIPHDLWITIRKSPVYFLDIPFEERLKHITEEYGCLDKQHLKNAIERIKNKLGGLNAKTAIQLLDTGNIPESFRILLKYYDKHYLKGLHKRENLNSLLHIIPCRFVCPENVNQLILASTRQLQKV